MQRGGELRRNLRSSRHLCLNRIGIPAIQNNPDALTNRMGYASGGKRLSGKTTPGHKALRTALIEAARAASHSKNTYLGAP